MYTEHPDDGSHNLGMYRMHVYDSSSTGMHWQIQKGGGFHYAVSESQGNALPVTVFLGGPPALILAAVAPHLAVKKTIIGAAPLRIASLFIRVHPCPSVVKQ